jgi:hypothetical protein
MADMSRHHHLRHASRPRFIGPGKEPKAAESEEGMFALQSFYDELIEGGMFGRLEDSYLTSNGYGGRGQALPSRNSE